MALLLENKKIAAATHNMMAFRIDCGKGVWSQDCDDDGEQGEPISAAPSAMSTA